jgi:predicted nucleotide-binding protein
MDESLGQQLVGIDERLSALAARQDDPSFAGPLDALQDSAEKASIAWSGSSFGYHALVYYREMQPPPPGARFSREWGLMGIGGGTIGDWCEYAHDDAIALINERAGTPDIRVQRQEAQEAERVLKDAQDDAISILTAAGRQNDDAYLKAALDKASELSTLSYDLCLKAQLPSGQFASRDTTALGQGLYPAPHQEIVAQVVSVKSPFWTAAELAAVCRGAARHLNRIGSAEAPTRMRPLHGNVAIGHGHSPMWRELKDFLHERLKLPWDEFNRVAVAGVSTTDRLQQMVDGCAMAFLVATAEDETADGAVSARQNVIHEIGLFQGHLGFSRAIVLLEEGCAEFSNIHGLGQIRFPKGNIAASFESIRLVLEREGLL